MFLHSHFVTPPHLAPTRIIPTQDREEKRPTYPSGGKKSSYGHEQPRSISPLPKKQPTNVRTVGRESAISERDSSYQASVVRTFERGCSVFCSPLCCQYFVGSMGSVVSHGTFLGITLPTKGKPAVFPVTLAQYPTECHGSRPMGLHWILPATTSGYSCCWRSIYRITLG